MEAARLLHASPRPTRMERLKSFYLQYISLMLIVITFVIGSFVTHSLKKVESLEVLPAKQSVQVRSPVYRSVTTLSTDRAFDPQSSILNTESLSAITELLLNHDLFAKIRVSASDSSQSSEVRAALALARSVSVYKALIFAGVPDAAISVSASELSAPELTVNVFRLEE